VAPRSAVESPRARGLFLIGCLRQPIRGHHRVERAAIGIGELGQPRRDRLDARARLRQRAFLSSVLFFDFASPPPSRAATCPSRRQSPPRCRRRAWDRDWRAREQLRRQRVMFRQTSMVTQLQFVRVWRRGRA
jgi:hypothetical protein